MSPTFFTTRQMALPLVFALAAPMASMAQTTATTTGATGGATTTTTTSPSTGKLVASYSQWAGSTANAQALVTSLRDGSTANLTSKTSGTGTGTGTTATTSFSPATGKMGVGEVGIALSLAQASLAKQGITNPTPAQISAALNGGMVTSADGTMSVPGVLAQRADGMGWGQIAQAMGVKLGSIMSASKTDKAKAGVAQDKAQAKTDGKGKDNGRSFLGMSLGAGAGNHSGNGNGNGNGGGHGGGHGGGGGGGGGGGK